MSPLFKRGGGDHERTPEERARARQERAAKRAKERGEPVPDVFDVEETVPPPMEDSAAPVADQDEGVGRWALGDGDEELVPAPEDPAAPAPPDEHLEPDPQDPIAPEPEPEPIAETPEPEPPTPNAQSPTPEPEEPLEPAPADPTIPAAHTEQHHFPADPADQAPDDPLLPHPATYAQATAEIPLEDLPDGGESFLAEEEAEDHEPYGPDEPPGPPKRHDYPPEPQRGRGRTWLLRFFALLALALVAAAIWFVVSLFQPFHGDASTKKSTVAIPKGADAGQIGDILERRGVISSSFFFDLRARLSGKRDDLKPGVYRLPQNSSYGDVLDQLSAGPPRAKRVAITIPEGRSRREEAARIRTNSNLQGSYLAATKRSRLLKPATYGAPRGTPSLEGFLFPATYELKSNAPVKALVDQQLLAFKRAIRRVNMRAAHRKNLTTYDVLTIASMVEREAMLRRERPIIAGVIYNRLKQNIPLGIDATIRYATGNWLRPLTQSQLRINSAYNTRTHQGLPPTPIGSPGIASIRAAAHPKRTQYLYYVVKPGGCGEHAFSKTFAQFQRDSARYNSARAQSGGKSPTKCK